ncbi:Phosphoribosyl 1,2-cyclic phosphodiesterase [Limimonas halophila]|uniref:Phosphoribosyl 1,2-cyclic phosphodiesterase n=1 Tax=Limimonas halophila TaxID=1082479 RepID=A0A1G7LIS3_9PROT|nr:MBL fold metallo-hydrolase [Limimonas halophila]SDF48900.1 Phosphoribosyl 1,2-cyclic phosphodiesterase [Limimonas halophila]
MQLTFLGTRAHIEAANRRHRRHSAALVHRDGARVMLDCGADWRERVHTLKPDAIVLTHGHPDHAFGLRDGAPCPVFATDATWSTINGFPIRERRPLPQRKPVALAGLTVEAFPVEHSTRCPAVGLRISADDTTFFYAPDVAYIPDRASALKGAAVYVGDGSSLETSHVRKQGARLVGHAPVRQQLTWCEKSGVPRAYFTHCGTEIVTGDERKLRPHLEKLAGERGVQARLAYDGLSVEIG